jgi:hypothetical protein
VDQSILSYCVIYQMDQSVLNSILKKICSNGHNHSSDTPWLVTTGIDYYSSIVIGVDDVIMLVATIHS